MIRIGLKISLCIAVLGITVRGMAQEVDAVATVAPKVDYAWNTFSLEDVRLQPGSPFYHAMQLNQEYLKGMDQHRMLNHHLRHGGLPKLEGQYPGSDQPVDTRPGYLDHYLTAIALMYAQTGDAEYKERVDFIIDKLAKTAQALADKGIRREFLFHRGTLDNLNRLQRGEITLAGPDETGYPWGGIGNIWYGVHKMLAGLRDAYLYTGNEQALQLWREDSDFITDFALHTNPDLFDNMLDIEHGGMNEVFADLYAITGEEKYMDVSKRFNHQKVILNTALDNNVLYGRHVNMQVPTFVGTARQYQLTADEVSKQATLHFLEHMYDTQNHAIGGSGRYERYLPEAQTSKGLGFTSDETCATYNMLKVAVEAFKFTGDLQHMDYYERALYNHILASQDPESGGFTYYTSLMPGGFKSFSDGYNLDGIWCCVGTGMENHSKYGRAIYFKHGNDLMVNLFIPSTLQWEEKRLQVTQHTNFPEEDDITLTLDESQDYNGTISFRYPSWAQGDAQVWINGKAVQVTSKPGQLITPDHNWKKGDEIKVRFPQHFSFEAASDDPHLKAMLRGPIVMAAALGADKMPGSDQVKRAMHYNNWITPQEDVPVLIADTETPEKWMDAGGAPLAFKAKNKGLLATGKTDVHLMPFYKIHGQRYAVYLKNYSPSELKQREQIVSDEVNPSMLVSEKEHDLKGENTDKLLLKDRRHFWENNRYGREAKKDGWFSYILNVNKAEKQYLTVTYWGSASWNRGLDIYVEGQKIATETLTEQVPISYYEKTYAIPAALIKGKQKITVRFQAKENTDGGAIYALKLSSNPEAFVGYGFY